MSRVAGRRLHMGCGESLRPAFQSDIRKQANVVDRSNAEHVLASTKMSVKEKRQ